MDLVGEEVISKEEDKNCKMEGGDSQEGIGTKLEKKTEIASNIRVEHTIPRVRASTEAFVEHLVPTYMKDSESLDNLTTKISSIGTCLEEMALTIDVHFVGFKGMETND